MNFIHSDINVLNNLRNHLQYTISYIWCFVTTEKVDGKELGVELVVRNAVDSALSPLKEAEVKLQTESFCAENSIPFNNSYLA